jgi:hypothetical protein
MEKRKVRLFFASHRKSRPPEGIDALPGRPVRQIDEPLTSTDSATVDLTAVPPAGVPTRLPHLSPVERMLDSEHRPSNVGCTVTMRANSALQRWLGRKNA